MSKCVRYVKIGVPLPISKARCQFQMTGCRFKMQKGVVAEKRILTLSMNVKTRHLASSFYKYNRHHSFDLAIAYLEIVSKEIWENLTRQPLGLRDTRQPLGGGHKVAPFTSAKISSQREEIEKRNYAHIFLDT